MSPCVDDLVRDPARRFASTLTESAGAPSIGAWFAGPAAPPSLPGWGPRRRDAQPYRSRAPGHEPDQLDDTSDRRGPRPLHVIAGLVAFRGRCAVHSRGGGDR